jgi:peptidoglycan/LPS O-acetylase OafA/YrhL
LAVPLLLYSQIFWLTNYGAYNYYAFYEEIYQQFYVKIAIFGYYIPDIFFFISAFLFTKKILSFEDKDTQIIHLFKSVGRKFVRLYPLYIVVLVIYWVVSPALHVGPIWYVYQQ